MGGIMERVTDFYDGWDSGDAHRFRAAVERSFAPGARIGRYGEAAVGLDEVMPLWLDELEAWRPMLNEVTNVIESGDVAVWDYVWTATHNRPVQTPEGRMLPASGRTIRLRAGNLARWDGERLTEYIGLFPEGKHSITDQLTTEERTAWAASSR